MVKIVTLFLVVIAALALLGRFTLRGRRGGSQHGGQRQGGAPGTFGKCRDCGKYRLIGSRCDCGTKG